MPSQKNSAEIEVRLRKRFLDRLSTRIKRMRRELVNRNWPVLKTECTQLRGGGDAFGFPELSRLAKNAAEAIPDENLSKARINPNAKQSIESLIKEIDQLLTAHQSNR